MVTLSGRGQGSGILLKAISLNEVLQSRYSFSSLKKK